MNTCVQIIKALHNKIFKVLLSKLIKEEKSEKKKKMLQKKKKSKRIKKKKNAWLQACFLGDVRVI